ncbi:MAG: lactate utilization protein [Chloroflexota bacterium]
MTKEPRQEFERKVSSMDRASREPSIQWYRQTLAERVIQSLEKNHIKGYYAPDRKEALDRIMGMIPEGAVVGVGDSITLHQVGVMSALRSGRYNFSDPFAPGLPWKQSFELRRKALLADVFLSGTNAITLDGKLVNTDGGGGRVAGMAFGPGKVIIAAGVNKIVKNVDEALKRVKEVAAPLSAKRHEWDKLPCYQTGVCADCQSVWRMCRKTLIIEGDMPMVFKEPRMHVVIIGETELGF